MELYPLFEIVHCGPYYNKFIAYVKVKSIIGGQSLYCLQLNKKTCNIIMSF